MKAPTTPKVRAKRTPATPASIPPSANVMTITRLTLMPMRAAISLSSATARIDLPVLVLATKRESATIPIRAVMITRTDGRWIGTPRMVQFPSRAVGFG